MTNSPENKSTLLRAGKDFIKKDLLEYVITIGVMSIAFFAGLSLFPVTESLPLAEKARLAVLTSASLYLTYDVKQLRIK